jgi:hypothetical protein
MQSRRLVLFGLAVLAALAALAPAAASAAVTPISSFGAFGEEAGQMIGPAGGEFASNGDYYVVDQFNSRIEVFSASGAFLFTFGKEVNAGDNSDLCKAGESCQEGGNGGAAGELAVPEALALLDGDVYVTEADNNRVSAFSEAGQFLFAFGKEVNLADSSGKCTVVSGCKAGEQGPGEGAFHEPSGIAASEERLFIADYKNNRVDAYEPQGTFSEAFGKNVKVGGGDVCSGHVACQEGGAGEAAGSLSHPFAIAVAGGRIYVSSEENNRIDVLTTAGAFVQAFGRGVAPGGGDVCTALTGCLEGAETFEAAVVAGTSALAVDAEGDVYVADYGGNRVSKFAPSGSFIHAWGTGLANGAAALQVCTTTCGQGLGGTGAASVNAPNGLAIDAAGRIAVAEAFGNLMEPFSRISLYTDVADVPDVPVVPVSPVTPVKPIAAPAPPAPAPSNVAKLGGLKLNAKSGTATLTVTLPDPGKLVLAGKGVKKVTKTAKKAGSVQLPVAAAGQARKKLKETGKVKLPAKLTFTPSGGSARAQSKSLTLKLELP